MAKKAAKQKATPLTWLGWLIDNVSIETTCDYGHRAYNLVIKATLAGRSQAQILALAQKAGFGDQLHSRMVGSKPTDALASQLSHLRSALSYAKGAKNASITSKITTAITALEKKQKVYVPELFRDTSGRVRARWALKKAAK